MGKNIPGGCIQIWRQEPLSKAYKAILGLYADYLNKVSVSFTIRFMEPQIKTEAEKIKVLKAIGYRPKEEIVICGFSNVIFDSANEIMMKFGGYLRVGVTRELIPNTKGKAYQINYYEKIGTSTIPRYYHILDCEFVRNYFEVGIDPKIQDICSLDEYTIHGISLKDLLDKKANN